MRGAAVPGVALIAVGAGFGLGRAGGGGVVLTGMVGAAILVALAQQTLP